MVSAWTEGVGAQRGAPYPEPVGKVAGHVGAMLRKLCATTEDAFNLGHRWATVHPLQTLEPLDFPKWAGSGAVDPSARLAKRNPADASYSPPPTRQAAPTLTEADIAAAEARGFTRKAGP